MQFGADPEVFLQDAAGNLISAIGLIGGTKENPRKLPIGKGFAVQEDNVAMEFNIPPASNAVEAERFIKRIMSYLSKKVADQGLVMSKLSAAEFSEEQLIDPRAQAFGCDPDYNAWADGERNIMPKADPALRSCGGHIHVGHKFHDDADVRHFIKRMDLFTGVPSVIVDQNGGKRRSLYGKPGAHRIKPYGCEYRVLSNFWIFEPKLVTWVYQQTQEALYRDNVDVDGEKDLILDAINNSNIEVAMHLIDKYGMTLPQ